MKPQLVVFSIDRSLHKNPNDKIVAGVLLAVPDAHVLCTQLSEKCAVNLPDENFSYLSGLPAKGLMDRKCCGGTISIEIGKDATTYIPSVDSHREFVAKFPNSLCRKFLR